MLSVHLSLAAAAVVALVLKPRSVISAAVLAAAAALGARLTPAPAVVAPLLAFLTAALTLSALIASSVLADHAAVVLIVPLIMVLHRRYRAPVAPLLLGAVAVANAASIAIPQGHPTNLVVINHLRISPVAFTAHMLAPGLAAATICTLAVALTDHRTLAFAYQPPQSPPSPPTRQQHHAALALALALALAAAALSAWTAPLLGIAPWWPLTAVVAGALLLMPNTTRPLIPWRITVQVAGLVILAQVLDLHAPGLTAPLAYAATIGLAVGALAAPQGSVATIIAADLSGPSTPPLTTRRLAPLAIAALLAATLLLKTTL
ncbi:MAG: SLC13 family permease [Solirubrobacteraceae bacterium]